MVTPDRATISCRAATCCSNAARPAGVSRAEVRGRGQQGHDRQPGRRVDQVVEPGGRHRADPARLPSMIPRSRRIRTGPLKPIARKPCRRAAQPSRAPGHLLIPVITKTFLLYGV